MKRKLLISAFLLIHALAFSQTTKVKGKVMDAETGAPVPFAAVYFKATTVGISSDMDGGFSLETRDREARILVCQLLGYETVETEITPGKYNEALFFLRPSYNRLSSITVKADDKKARALLEGIDRNRKKNEPEQFQDYNCDIYNKMEMDLTHPWEQIGNINFMKDFGLVFDYIDTSSVSGVPYLPLMISESVAKRRHSRNPDIDDENIVANKISGIRQDFNLLTQFTGNMLLKINFYQAFFNAYGVELPSPAQKNGMLYYNYYIVDSLNVNNRKTLIVHFHPKDGISTPAFDGEMQVDAADFALRSVRGRMKHGGNVNWVKELVLEAEYEKGADSIWFYKRDKLYSEFSVFQKDSSEMMTLIGTRELSYSNVSFERPETIKPYNGAVTVDDNANFRNESYWEKVRPYELSTKEKNIYKMVREVQDTRLYDNLYKVVYTLATGYFDFGPIGVGRILNLVSFNNLEGCRAELCLHTSKDFSEKYRLSVMGAYGTKDRNFKGGATFESVFDRDPTRKLSLNAHYDVLQLGKGKNEFTSGNILSSIWHSDYKLCMESSASAVYDHEFSPDFNFQAAIEGKRIFGNEFVPLINSLGEDPGSIAVNEIRLKYRFSKEERVIRGRYNKVYDNTLHPVWTIDLTGSVPGLRKGDYGYFKPELSMQWKLKLPPMGISRISANVGTILGQVPYHLLHIHEGNATAILDRTAFSCMDYFEFVSDTWATLFWEHNFYGFFLGKIPLVRRLNLREVIGVKATWGMLRDENNWEYNSSLPLFPAGCGTLGKVPYVELNAGITNIFRMFRIDCNWRMTHRTHRLFMVNFGLDLHF